MRMQSLAIYGVLVGMIAALSSSGASAEDAAPAAALQPAAGAASVLTYSAPGQTIHAMPTVPLAKKIKAAAPASSNDLIYHSGGEIMRVAKIYAIYWEPPKMQNGETTKLIPAKYQARTKSMLGLYDHEGLSKNNTQYYQIIGGKKTNITFTGEFAGSYVDKATKFPAPGCSDSATPGNCLSDAQLQAEVKHAIAVNKWVANIDTIFFVYTPEGMGSCFSSSSSSCAYTAYCAYHSAFGTVQKPTIYANEPYGDANACWDGGPSPSGDIPTDSVLDTSSHELTEAITDPLLNAWFNSSGAEIGDICNFTFGTDKFDGGKANQDWSGQFFRLQEEYDNHRSACVQAGP